MKESSENTAPEFFVVKSKGIAASVLNVNLDGVAPEKKIPNKEDGTSYVYWGSNNQRPNELYKAGKKSSIIKSGLTKMAQILYGGGVEVGEYILNKNTGREEFVPVTREKGKLFYDFKFQSNLEGYLLGSIFDLYWFKNVFPQIGVNLNRDKIVQLKRQKASDCRWAWQNKEGNIEKCFISHKFEDGPIDVKKEDVLTRSVLNPDYDPKGQLDALLKKKRSENYFIYPLKYPGITENYYAEPDWVSAIESGWLDLANKIAQFKNSLMENQISIIYHIEIDTRYWSAKFPKWDEWDAKKKKETSDTVISDWLNSKTGPDKAGNVQFTPMVAEDDGQGGKNQVSYWKVSVVDNKLKDGAFILDSQEASAHIFAAIGLDPTITGVLPGKGQMPSSGSDKRVAVNMQMNFQQVHRDLILKPLYLIRDFNGWPSTWEFRFKTPEITKLDSGKEFKEI